MAQSFVQQLDYESFFPVPDNMIPFSMISQHFNLMASFCRWKDPNLCFSVPIRTLISFNVRTELEVTQFLNVAIVIENELKVSVGLQAAKLAAKFLRIGGESQFQL